MKFVEFLFLPVLALLAGVFLLWIGFLDVIEQLFKD